MPIEHKGKSYPVKDLFLYDEAKLLKAVREFRATDDPEKLAEISVRGIHIATGIDQGELNGLKYNAVLTMFGKVIKEYTANIPPDAEGEEKKAEAPPQRQS